MSQTKIHKVDDQGTKKHGDPLESALEVEQPVVVQDEADPVPAAENGGHPRSAAAHLESARRPNTKPAGNLRQGSHPGALREPPMVVQRVGKQHRGE